MVLKNCYNEESIISNYQSLLLANDNYEMFAHHDIYCAWSHYYKIDKYNLAVKYVLKY